MITIRKAESKDLKNINSFLIEMNMLKFDETSFCESCRFIYVLEKDKVIDAFISFIILSDIVELEAIYTTPKSRKNGYGMKLMRQMENKAKENNSKSIFLEVRENNKIAQHLYQKNGYVVINQRKKYYGEENGIVMKKELR